MTAARALDAAAPTLVAGDYPLTVRSFRAITSLLRAQSGIHLPESKATLVHSRLVKRLRELNLESFDQYCALIASGAGADERTAMLAALTTNVTRFFREPHHFDHFRDRLERVLAAKVKAGGKLRIWSSACSTGEEAYSIALSLLSVLPDACGMDVKILASDIDPNVVNVAKAGVYRDQDVAPIPAQLRDRWLIKPRDGDGNWRISDTLRSLVVFRVLNLIGDWPMRGKFDAIFCRNVVIYFEQAAQDQIWTRFRDVLDPQGRLYVGHSERIDAPGYRSDGLTIYRLEGAS